MTPILQPNVSPLFLLCHSRPKQSTIAEVCTSICQVASQRRSVLTGPLAADPALLSNQAAVQTSLLTSANLEATTLRTHNPSIRFGSWLISVRMPAAVKKQQWIAGGFTKQDWMIMPCSSPLHQVKLRKRGH